MAVVCRKSGFPIECPSCNIRIGAPERLAAQFGQGADAAGSLFCLQATVVHMATTEVEPLFGGQQIHIRIDQLLQALALTVLAVPMCRVEKLVGIKAETVKAKLMFLLEAHRWESLDYLLEERFRIPRSYRSDFKSMIVQARELDVADFSSWAKQLRYQEAADRAACARLASRILGRPLHISDITAQSKRRRMRP